VTDPTSPKTIVPGREVLAPGYHLARHRHLQPYAIVLIAGCFEQVSYAGRVRVCAGDLLIQPALDCHANRLISSGAAILRLPWDDVDGLGGVVPLADLDAVVRAAERDPREAMHLARSATGPHARPRRDWPDDLAAGIVDGDVARLATWAEETGVARETVARGFHAAYGVSPRQFRAELRARDAWLEVVRTRHPLAAIAAATGFADQAHMTRAIRALTGAPPGAWRRDRRTAGFWRDAGAQRPW